MSYEPTSWQNGDIVTANKLNNIERGIETLSEAKGTADTLLDGATSEDAGKIVTINDVGEAVLTPYAEMYGSPLAARTPEGMTDTSRIYVYSGETGSGYTQGYWYFYNGTNWEEGGNYEGRSDITHEIIDDEYKLPTSKAVYDEFHRLINLIYPIGSLYFSTSPVNPSTYLGGYWIRYAEGKTIFGASDTDTDFTNEGTGGSKVTAYAVGGPNGHTHKTGSDNYERFLITSYDKAADKGITGLRTSGNDTGNWIVPAIEQTRENRFATTETTEFNIHEYVEGYGSVFTANNLPPYISCYIWMRVAEPIVPVIQEPLSFSIDNVKECFRSRVLAVKERLDWLDNNSSKMTHFIFITDMHEDSKRRVTEYTSNYNESQAIAMYLIANTGADKIVLGADYSVSEWDEDDYKAYVRPFIENGFADYVYPVLGNHERMLPKYFDKDMSTFPDSGYAGALARASVCNDFLLSKNNIVGNIQEGYYYLDDLYRKTRFLFINTSDQSKYSMSDNQLRWLGKVALDAPDNSWTLVIFGHCNIRPAHLTTGGTTNSVEEKNGQEIERVLGTWGGHIAGYFCGHQHIDSRYKSGGFYHVVSYCDKFKPIPPTGVEDYQSNKPTIRDPGGYTSQAVTVVSFNPEGGGVEITRIGAGANKFEPDFGDGSQTDTYNFITTY